MIMLFSSYLSYFIFYTIFKHRFCVQIKNIWAHIYLIFVKLAVFIFLFSLVLEGDDDKTDEDVDHEEGDDDDVDEVEYGDGWTMVVNWTVWLLVRVDWLVQQTEIKPLRFNTKG